MARPLNMSRWHWLLTLGLVLAQLSASGVVWADNLQDLVNQANTAANAEQYTQAIDLYERAVELSSGDPQLKKNLSVLYYNQAVKYQTEKQYLNAHQLLDKAIQLSPGQSEPVKAKAATYYYEAMDLKSSPQGDLAKVEALLLQAIDINPNEPAYKHSLASGYLSEARELAAQEQFIQAAEVLEKAYGLDPDASAIQRSLANVYLGAASQQAGNPEAQQVWVNKALVIDPSEAMENRAKNVLKGKVAYASQGSSTDENGVTLSQPKNTANYSIQDKVAQVEESLAITPPTNATLIQRVEAVEKNVFGKKQDGGDALQGRVDKVFLTLFGTGQTVAHSTPNLVQSSVQTAQNTYLEDIFNYTDGRVVRWVRFPLRVYLEPPEDETQKTLYTEGLEQAVLAGLDTWKKATNGFVSYTTVKNPLAADVRIKWSDKAEDRFNSPEHIANNHLRTYEPPKRSKLAQTIGLAAAFTPGVFSLAPQAVAAGLQLKEQRKLQAIEEESFMMLTMKEVIHLPADEAKLAIQNQSAHEFGHILGLKGCSTDPGDLMFSQFDALKTEAPAVPSERDLNTLKALYNRPPNIILNVR